MSALASALGSASALPYFHLGSLDVGIPIQAFGVIVAIGVLIGAGVLRRYGEWHGISDDHIRGITGWVTISGFIGAHIFDVLFYQWDKLEQDPLLLVMLWKGISSYGGFLGGALGWWIYVWWKRLPMRLMADVTILGLLVAFSIGRIGCTVVSDHIGAAVGDPTQWYAALAMDYPRHLGNLGEYYTEITTPTIKAWNLGLLELLYLIPVNIFILWYAFRPSKRPNAGMVTALTGLLYAPVRFVLDFLRFDPESDPRYFDLTFAQWVSIVAFGASIALIVKIAKNGAPAEPVTKTSGEAQRRLKLILKEDEEKREVEKEKKEVEKEKSKDKTTLPKAVARETEREDKDDEALAKEAEAAASADDAEEDEAEKPATGAKPATKPAGNRPKPGGGSSKKKKRR
jgi:phosphatidylglycerol:prolipoprotein diacylglycerol transferase